MNKFLFILSIFSFNAFTTNLDTKNSLIEFYGKSNTKINIVIKDNIDIQGKVTSVGSLALENNIASKNAYIVQKLIDADFQIAGKANLSEWANFRSEDSVSGWSSYGGQTEHFLNAEYNPCGSSSGSAVAVAIGIVDIAIGTETNGSISCPSSVNGIVGFKPTVGLVSRSGIVPISSTQDTAGPMGKSVTLVAKTLEAIAGYDPLDPATKDIPDDLDLSFSKDLGSSSIAGKRFAILQSDSSNKLIKPRLDEIKKIILESGAILVEIDDTREYPGEDEYFLLKYEFKYGLEEYLRNATEKKKTLKEIIDFNNKNRKSVMPHFGQDILIASLEASKDEERYKIAIKKTRAIKDKTLSLFIKHNLDAMIGLTRGPAWKINYEGGDSEAIDRSKSFGNGGFAAISGLPHLTIPFFEVDNFPVGLSIIGSPWSDKKVLEIGAFLERKKKVNYNYEITSIVFSDEPLVIDVRSIEEVKNGIIQDAIHIEWTKIDKEITKIDLAKDQPIYLYCRSGNRSGKATEILEKIGFTNVTNAGGIKEASEKLDKKIVKYSE